jgi:putative nucleotidyltransferase with HDIG domain
MSVISFNKIKLFRRAEIQPRRTQVEPPQGETKPPLPLLVLKSPWTFAVLSVVAIALFLSYVPTRSLGTVSAGEIAPADIVAPFDLLLQDDEATEKRREAAAAAVLPIYTLDPNVAANTEDKVRRLFALGRETLKEEGAAAKAEELRNLILDNLAVDLDLPEIQNLIRLKFPVELEESLVNLLRRVFRNPVVLSRGLFIHGEEELGLVLLTSRAGEREIRVTDLTDLKESETLFLAELDKLGLPQRSRSVLAALGSIFVSPNVTYNPLETDTRKGTARNMAPVVTTNIKKGRVLVRRGDEVSEDVVEIVGQYNQRLEKRAGWLPNFIGSFLFFGILFAALWPYLVSALRKEQVLTHFRMIGTFLVASLAIYKMTLSLAETISGTVGSGAFSQSGIYAYAFPFQMGAIVFAFLTSTQMTLTFAILNSLTVGFLLGADFNLMIFAFVGGLAAVYGVRYFRKATRLSILRSGVLAVSPVNVLLILTFHLIENRGGAGAISSEMLMGLLGGVVSAALAFVVLPVVESLFGFITPAKLLELSNSDLPIFRRMSLEAPGSYHHSLIVATLAEKAAEELGLDAQLVKAGALYHDIGKTKRPEYFIENRSRESDLHKDLRPSMSTLVIINHVKEGVEIAKKLKLPKVLRDIIEQHHGNSLVRYFFNKAKLTYDPEQQKIGEESYRYPGPPPQTREAAVIMLADSVEAASRSLRAPTRDNLRRVITDILNSYLQDGQLDDCDISLRELRAIATSFLGVIYAIYHPRIEYPGFEYEVRKDKKPPRAEGNHDRNHQPPAKTPDPKDGV